MSEQEIKITITAKDNGWLVHSYDLYVFRVFEKKNNRDKKE